LGYYGNLAGGKAMTEATINAIINRYVHDNLSPKQEQRDYISKKYQEISDFLGGYCFQAGSYARFTAIHPVHDLDVIYVVKEVAIKTNPKSYMDALCAKLRRSGITGIKKVSCQTHSVTIEFEFGSRVFSIDIVPALELSMKNEFGDPLYDVPEILKMHHSNRQYRYESADSAPIGWVRTDPKGYIDAATIMNDLNGNYRHATKYGKGWRHSCKDAYGDQWKLKAFHLEQIFYRYFVAHPSAYTLDAVVACLGQIVDAINKPVIPDRADNSVYIDAYVAKLTPKEKTLIIRMQADAYAAAQKLRSAKDETELKGMLAALLKVKGETYQNKSQVRTVTNVHRPWAC
jgi:hypothetical protein